MTDEEKLAEEWVNKEWTPFRFYDAGCDVYNDDIREDVKEAYLAGLKAGKDMAEADLATVAYMQGATQQKKKSEKQLTKAKEFLNEFMRISKAIDEDFEHDYSELIGETDQFLKEKA